MTTAWDTESVKALKVETMAYSALNRFYIGLCGLASGMLGYAAPDSNMHKILYQQGGVVGQVIVTASFLSGLLLLLDVFYTTVLRGRSFRYRHVLFVIVSFGWASLLYLGSTQVSLGAQVFWIANICMAITTALVDAHSRGSRVEESIYGQDNS